MLREQDRFLPICNIIKIMKMTIPDNGKIAKDARECLQECVSEFISFITSEAIDKSYSENRKTVNGDDLLYAFIALGFDNYVPPLQAYLRKFRESTKCDRNIVYSTIHPDGECLDCLEIVSKTSKSLIHLTKTMN